MVTQSTALVASEEDGDEVSKEPEPWVSEPKLLSALMDEYIIENKFPGRAPGTSLYVVQARKRNGETTECLEGQHLKFLLVFYLHPVPFDWYQKE